MFVWQFVQAEINLGKHQCSASLSLCEGNPLVTGVFPHKGPVMLTAFLCHDVTWFTNKHIKLSNIISYFISSIITQHFFARCNYKIDRLHVSFLLYVQYIAISIYGGSYILWSTHVMWSSAFAINLLWTVFIIWALHDYWCLISTTWINRGVDARIPFIVHFSIIMTLQKHWGVIFHRPFDCLFNRTWISCIDNFIKSRYCLTPELTNF